MSVFAVCLSVSHPVRLPVSRLPHLASSFPPTTTPASALKSHTTLFTLHSLCGSFTELHSPYWCYDTDGYMRVTCVKVRGLYGKQLSQNVREMSSTWEYSPYILPVWIIYCIFYAHQLSSIWLNDRLRRPSHSTVLLNSECIRIFILDVIIQQLTQKKYH